MIKPAFYLLATLALMTEAQAQTNAPAPRVGSQPTQIWSDSGYFDMHNRLVIYTGHVRVEDPRLKMTCDKLTARTPENGGQVDSVAGEGNVVMDIIDEKGQTNHATGDKVVYSYTVVNSATNDTVVLTGNPEKLPHVRTPQADIIGTKFIWDRMTGLMTVENQQSIINMQAAGITNGIPGGPVKSPEKSLARTNMTETIQSSANKTETPAATTNQ